MGGGEDGVVAGGREEGAVRGVVRPIAPVFAFGIFVVFLVVLIDETLWIAPNGLHDARPGIADANVAGISRARLYFFSFFVPNHRINSEHARTGPAALHQIHRRLAAADEPASLLFPPAVDNY